MNYAGITHCSVVDGVGFRTVLWCSGCTHNCEDCHNKELHDFNHGKEFTTDTLNKICEDMDKDYVAGLTLSGGDPLMSQNITVVTSIAEYIKYHYPNKTIWVYTGTDNIAEIKDLELLKFIDVIVIGRYEKDKRSSGKTPFKGSSNQEIIDVSSIVCDDNGLIRYNTLYKEKA